MEADFFAFKTFFRQSVWVFEGRASPEEFLRPFFERAADSEDRRKGKDHICRGAEEKDFFKGNEKNSFLTAAKPSVPRTVRVVLLVVGGGAVCLSIA